MDKKSDIPEKNSKNLIVSTVIFITFCRIFQIHDSHFVKVSKIHIFLAFGK